MTSALHSNETATKITLHKTAGDIVNTNFPKDAEGNVYHLAVKAGQLAPNILIVGDPNRAKIVATHLKPDPDLPDCFPHSCSRGFDIYTGFFEGKKVSVVATGMGTTMIDFFVREARAIVDGQMQIIRLGSCGSPNVNISVGDVVLAEAAVGVTGDTRPWNERKVTGTEYTISNPAYPDTELKERLYNKLVEANAFKVVRGLTATTDSFYSSQGRIDPAFPDQNENLLDDLEKKYPGIAALSMEAYHLFNLADMNTDAALPGQGIKAAVCKIVLAARKAGVFLSNEQKHTIELSAGRACLLALIS